MKNLLQIAWRLLKVTYVVILLLGFMIGLLVWVSTPEKYSYLVICNNGKTYDPTSKPIDHTYDIPYKFSILQTNAECRNGVGGENIPPGITNYSNNTITKTPHADDKIINTFIAVLIYYLIVEMLRRTFLYIFFGKSFVTLRRQKGNKK